MMFRRLTRLWPCLLLAPAMASAQTTEFGGIQVIQNTSANNAAAVTLSKAPGSSPNFQITGGNRGDYALDVAPGIDQNVGVLIPCVSELSRDNTAQGDTIGLFYATAATSPDEGGGDYTVAIFTSTGGGEANINTTFGFFPYNRWIGGTVRNSTNNGEMSEIVGTTGLALGTHVTDLATPAGQYTLDLNSVTGNSASQNGVLLVTGAKNEDNYALSQSNADGTFNLFCHDNGANGADYENDGVSFVYLPLTKVGTDKLTAVGRVKGNAALAVSASTPGHGITVTKGGTGIWYLAIAGESASTGTLIVSPEGGVGNNVDNIVTHGWDAANNRWIIESRDLPGPPPSAPPALQNVAATDDVFSFAFFTAPVLPQVTLTSPVSGSVQAQASFTLEATATDADGSVAKVEFLRNGEVIATDAEAPYSFSDASLPPGHYDYQARATDNDGNIAITQAVQMSVSFAPGTAPANTALSFDGSDDHVTMGPAPSLNVGQLGDDGFTLECWFRREGPGLTSGSGSGGTTAVPLFGKGRGESDGTNVDCNIFFGITADGVLTADFEAHPATGISAGANYPITGAHAPVSLNVWHHAAVTYDHATFTWKLYLDGVPVGSSLAAAEARPRYDSIQHFAIGTSMTSTGASEGAFRGRIDEARVWSYARSETQIAESRNQHISSASGLKGLYALDEGTGLSTSGLAGANPGALVNGPLWVEGAPLGQANLPPGIILTRPVHDSTMSMPAAVLFEATATDADGTVALVEFLVDGQKVGEDSSAPYAFSWSPPAAGNYAISARATDDKNAVSVSGAATIHVLASATPPVVSLTAPADAASITTGNVNLRAQVFDADGDAMSVTFYGRHTTPATPGQDFSIIQIPDTQFYSQGSSSRATNITVAELIATFGEQTQWVVNNRQNRNIAFTSHMGDIVQSGNNGGNDIEWVRASSAMARLENPATTLLAHGMPFGAAPGNHDIDPIGNYDAGSTRFYNQYFGVSRFAGRTYYGGHYGTDNTNNYQLFSVSGLDFIAIHFAYDTSPNKPILDWADALMKAHPHRRAMVTSHSIIGGGNPGSFSAQGRAIYDALKNNPNFFLMLCGHIHAEGRRADVYDGRTIYTVLSDYQSASNGGNGFLRLLKFSPADNTIRLESYSPTLNRAVRASDSIPNWEASVTLPYDMQAAVSGWIPLGTVAVPAGGTTAELDWTGLEAGKNYEWYAAVSDGTNTGSSAPRRFRTTANQAPTVTLDSPQNNSAFATPVTITLTATAADADGTVQRVEFYKGGEKLGEDTSSPYSFAWTNPALGTHKISAVAVDNSNQAAVSNVATITVQTGDELPTVILTAPANGTALPAPANVTLAANALDTEAPVQKVEFFSGTTSFTSLGVDTQAPFSLDLTSLVAGTYTFTARATDTAGQVVTSAPVTVSVFVEATVPGDTSHFSVGTFDPPSWTIVKTGPATRAFNDPGTNEGDLELKIGGTPVAFNSGITLATNWNSPATIALSIGSYDNLCKPYAGSTGNAWISVLDCSNNNGGDDNPTTSEQTSGISVAHLPYSAGWTGASVDVNGVVLSGNLPAGVSVSNLAAPGAYSLDGLSTAGNLLAVANGNGGTAGDNICSVRVEDGRWIVDVRDNNGTGQNGPFSFLYIPPTTAGIYAAAVNSTGTVTRPSPAVTAIGLTATPGTEGIDLQFGDGTVINPTTAALFVAADSTRGGGGSAAADNIVAWANNGNTFRVFTQDLPQINGNHQAIDLRILVIPYASASPPASEVTITATDAAAQEQSADQALAFTITRTGSTAAPLTISLAAAGTATAGTDYTGFLSSIEIPATQASVVLPLTVLPDALSEGEETVSLSLLPAEAYAPGTPASATATITDRSDQGWYFNHIPDAAKRGPADDADGDGLANALEYYLGTHPGSNLSTAVLDVTVENNTATFWFPRSLNADHVTAHVEWSTDLVHWFRHGQSNGMLAVNIAVTSTSQPTEDPQLMKGTATHATGGSLPGNLFFRLSVSP